MAELEDIEMWRTLKRGHSWKWCLYFIMTASKRSKFWKSLLQVTGDDFSEKPLQAVKRFYKWAIILLCSRVETTLNGIKLHDVTVYSLSIYCSYLAE